MNQRLESQRSGTTVRWSNPFTGNSGNVTILATDDSNPELPCRTYRLTTETPGRPPIIVEGTGCRVVPGIWQRTETLASATPSADRPAAGPAEPEPSAPPLEIPPPERKPDPNFFFASVPTPSDMR